LTIVYGILGLSLLVLLHELGHFFAARLSGVKVESFSIGMGPVLFHHKWGQTDYRISLIPLGGYCGMKGEKDYQYAIENNLKQIDGDKDSFYGVHPLKRLLIAFAGPFSNLFFAFIAFSVISIIGYTYYTAGCTVKMADEIYTDVLSPAHEAGLQSGDTIISINDKLVEDFSEIAEIISLNPDEDLIITVERSNKQYTYTVHSLLDKETGSGKIGIVGDPDSVIQKEYKAKSFFSGLLEGLKQTWQMLVATLKSIKILFKGINLSSVVSGPARITTMLGSTVQEGFSQGATIGIISTLQFLAFISISLFITNLLPVPILDGGLILFALIEIVLRRKIHPKVLYYVQLIGIAFIALMLVLAINGDIHYFIKR